MLKFYELRWVHTDLDEPVERALERGAFHPSLTSAQAQAQEDLEEQLLASLDARTDMQLLTEDERTIAWDESNPDEIKGSCRFANMLFRIHSVHVCEHCAEVAVVSAHEPAKEAQH